MQWNKQEEQIELSCKNLNEQCEEAILHMKEAKTLNLYIWLEFAQLQ